MQGPWGASQARQTTGWRRPAPSSPATRACGSSVEQGSRCGREPRVGGRLLLGHLPWAGALCQGALAEPLQGAWRRMDGLPRPLTTGPAGSKGVQLCPTDLGVMAESFSEGAQNRAVPGPQAAAPRGLGGRKGKGDVIAAWNLLFGGVAMETGRLRPRKPANPDNQQQSEGTPGLRDLSHQPGQVLRGCQGSEDTAGSGGEQKLGLKMTEVLCRCRTSPSCSVLSSPFLNSHRSQVQDNPYIRMTL
ncbi:hypothetical protein HispidOSU_003845 [Sigmodon hispidus]